ncbi:MAG: hypothetical protein CMI26_07740 [Opitutae bacterium]|nr:hypothetical protein [Opitutae bacterium]
MNLSSFLCSSALLAVIGLQVHAQKPPKGFEKIDQEIVISTMEAQMKYDVRSFSVKPNAKIKLVFKNPDALPHNLIICTPGKKKGGDRGQEVVDAVMKLGDKGVEQNWEPKGHPRILVSSGMVQPKKETTLYFKSPKKEGDYPYICTFPGHFQLMNGVMGVSRLANPITNLTYKLYHGKWNKAPDFTKLEAKKTGVLASGLFDISAKDKNDGFGFVFSGKIDCPKDGKYSFTISSDDGSLLLIDNKIVVNNDGIHANSAKSGSITLKKGQHDIEVRYFEASGQEGLSVAWSGPGIKNQALSKSSPGGGGGGGAIGLLIEPPEGEASVYRNFINGAGPRAIGVGYHEGLNLAFDANNLRLAMIWQGDFIDGARHWKGRGQGYQPPAGEAVIKFPDGVAFATLGSSDSAWPQAEYRTKDFRFRGYVLDKSQRPTFKYERGGVAIEDTPLPVATAEGEFGQIKRVIKLKAKDAPANLYFRIAQGGFEKKGDTFQSSELSVTVKGANPSVQSGDLRVPVTFKGGTAEFEVTYAWAN